MILRSAKAICITLIIIVSFIYYQEARADQFHRQADEILIALINNKASNRQTQEFSSIVVITMNVVAITIFFLFSNIG